MTNQPVMVLLQASLLALAACTPSEPAWVPAAAEPPFGPAAEDVLPPLCVATAQMRSRRVAPELMAWAEATTTGRNDFYSTTEIDLLESTAELEPHGLIDRGEERAEFGDFDGAVADLREALSRLEGDSRTQLRALDVLAVVLMRAAEIQNCTAAGAQACLYPFDPTAVHADPVLMTEAAEALRAALAIDDTELFATRTWLHQVAIEAAGLSMDSVPAELRPPLPALPEEATLPAWTSVAASARITASGNAGASITEDFDGDGRLDVLFSSMNPEEGMSLWLNVGDGTWCDGTAASGVNAAVGALNATVADYDNDGDIDIFAPRGGWMYSDGTVRPSLLRNAGGGVFQDDTVDAGLAETIGPTQVAVWSDVDGDGWVDLFVGREATSEEDDAAAPASLFLNQADGTFVDVAAAAGVAEVGFIKGAALGDLDGDGDPDLAVSRFGAGPQVLFNHDGVFVPSADVLPGPRLAFATSLLDYDQDGDLDLLVTGYPDEPPFLETYARALWGNASQSSVARLYENDGAGRLTDVTAAVQLDDVTCTMGLGVGDLDADGRPDLLLSTGAPSFNAVYPNVAYVNRPEGFLDATASARLGHLQKGHGVAFADLDEDGDEDLVINLGGAYPSDGWERAVFAHPDAPAAAITVRLEGTSASRDAMGARVELVTDVGSFHHVVGPGTSFGGNSLQIEAALPGASTILEATVRWPDGMTETFTGLSIGTYTRLVQGAGVGESRPFARRPLGRGPGSHGH
jgi:hypothetical protein